ncbi:MAG: helix-turn-helix domain-containing protein [Alphaproteobacteria bacterium]
MRRGYEPDTSRSNVRPSSVRSLASAHRPAAPAAGHLAPEVGRFFLDLRQVFRISREKAAQQLATRVDIIAALEAGDVRKLPPWPETCRIVRTYAAFARLDPRPVLHSIETLIAYNRHVTTAGPQSMLASLSQRGALAALADFRSKAFAAGSLAWNRAMRDHRRAGRAILAVAVPIALLVLLTQTAVLEAGVAQFPEPVARFVRGAQDYVTLQLAPIRHGLRWVDVADPRTRRGDKLKTVGQPD